MVKKRAKKIKPKKSSNYLFPAAVVLVVVASAYAVGGSGNGGEEYSAPSTPPPVRSTPVAFPDYAKVNDFTHGSYIIAWQIPTVLEAVPCYCGCGGVGHESLRDCFLHDDDTFDNHGANCQVCMDEAYDTYGWYMEGVPLKEIRSRIDSKYGRAFADPTDTPPVL